MFQHIKDSISEVDNSLCQTIKNTLLFRYARVYTVLGSWVPWITHIWYGVIVALMGSSTSNSWFLLSSLLPKEHRKFTLPLLIGGLLLFSSCIRKLVKVAVALACVSTLQCSVQRCFVRQLLLCQCWKFQIYFTTTTASLSSTKISGSRKEAWTKL